MEQLLTMKEVAEKLRISMKSARNLIKNGEIKGLKVGGLWRIRVSDFESFLCEGAESAHAAREEGLNPKERAQVADPAS